ncbi:hypothetical protein DFQ29_006224 [Apophysomyces sp. BC1021]|nr:hypothetical protein DFQ29_006224 [Apophysomyces sp. BC1021]
MLWECVGKVDRGRTLALVHGGSEKAQNGWNWSAALSEPEIAQLKTTFETYTKGKGFTASTLAEIYRKAKINISPEEIQSQFQATDANGNGRLDFDAFLAIMERQHQRNAEEGILYVFEMLDTDKDGLISGNDLQRLIVDSGK